MRVIAVLLAVIAPFAAALKFDLHPVSAHDAAKYERCIRNFVAKEQLVVVTAILDGYRGDGQKVDMHVSTQMPIPQAQYTGSCKIPRRMLIPLDS